MEHTEQPYQDSPTSSPASSRSSTPTQLIRALRTKPLPLLPREAVPHPTESYNAQPIEPYRDDPGDSETEEAHVIVSPLPTTCEHSNPSHTRPRPNNQVQVDIVFRPYTDANPENDDDDDIPLAYLYPYPTEAPPSYQYAVRESYRATLIQNIQDNSVSIHSDEDADVERQQADDERYTMERVVAAVIVAMILLLIAVMLGIVALSSSSFIK